MDPAIWELLRTGSNNEAEEVEAIIRLDRPHVNIAGVRIVSRFGPIATCRLRRDSILGTREEENVLSLKAARLLGPEVEPEGRNARLKLPLTTLARDLRRPPGLPLTGAGVAIGILDWGCDFNHRNFKHPDGSTRLIALWDQRGRLPPGAPSHYGYGTVHSKRKINYALTSADPYGALKYHPADADSGGHGAHGTHVMGIAAGNGLGGGPMGVAPEADLIFVHLANKDTDALANLGDSVRIIEAVDFVARTAGNRPWVINLSVGRHGGPHDGSTLCEMAFDFALSAAPDRFIVQSGGNYFGKNIHSSGRLQAGQMRTLHLRIDEADVTPNELEVWYSGEDELAVKTQSPHGTPSPWVRLGQHADIIENNRIVGRIYNRASDPNNSDNHIDIFLYPGAPPGAWSVMLRADKISDGVFHAWLERDEACPGCQTQFSESDSDSFYTTGTLANSHIPLVVGAYNSHSPAREVSSFSSVGPTRDHRPKPDLVAPGEEVLAARSTPRDWRKNPGLFVRKSGSSMATPHVTGAVALCLQGVRRPLWSHEIRELILNNAEPVSAQGQHALRFGRGYLDVARVVEAVLALPPRAATASIFQVANTEEHRHDSKENKMDRHLDEYFDRLEQVMKESTSRTVSEKNLLAEILRTNGAPFYSSDPDKLYREIVFNRDGRRTETLAGSFRVLARPGEAPEVSPRAGDVLLRVALGEPGLGHVAVISDSSLWPHDQLASAPCRSENRQPGFYATVIDGGASHHLRSNPFARRILDAAGKMPPGQVLFRIESSRDDESSVETSTSAFEGELFDQGPVIQSDAVISSEQYQRDYDFEAIDPEEEDKFARRLGDENGQLSHDSLIHRIRPEFQNLFRPSSGEAEFGELGDHLFEAEKEELGEIGRANAFYEGTAFEDMPNSAYDAQILIQKARTATVPAQLTLAVHRWEEAEATPIRGARLKLFEIDMGEAGRSDTATVQNDQIAEFTLDLAPNPEFVKNPNKADIPHVSVSNARWANPTLEKSFRATRQVDFNLKLGQSAFPLWIPRQDILEEGNAVELGFVLEDSAGNKVERLSIASNQVLSVPIPNYLEEMVKIPGRFDDPKRDPAVEMDGTKFDEFLKGKNRREFISQWREQHPALKEAANEPGGDLKTSDIVKAWFVIHDVGVKTSLPDKHYKANQEATKNHGVHGFLNRSGYYAATYDFRYNFLNGTLYEFQSKNGLKHVNGRTINIETVPDIESVPDKADGLRGDPSNPDLYTSIGYRDHGKKVTYYKWTNTALDVLADLYIFASARAGHLLTITVHKEMDRNLARSVLWREYSAAELRVKENTVSELLRQAGEAQKRGEKKNAEDLYRNLKPWYLAVHSPSDYHGDPFGFNIQALYDLITKKLNALGGNQMPVGARYGIHPRRVCEQDGKDITNVDDQQHEFPHQSDPVIKQDKALKKQGWWKKGHVQGGAMEEVAESPTCLYCLHCTKNKPEACRCKGKTGEGLAEFLAGEDAPAKAPQTTAVVSTQPDGMTRVPTLDVFSSPKATSTKQVVLQYQTEIPRIISKKEVSKGEWWYEIEYMDGTQKRTGWASSVGIAELAWPGKFTFLTPGGDGWNSPFEELRDAVNGKPAEGKVARSINFLNLVLLPNDKMNLGDFVRESFYQAIVAAKGNFKEASLILTATIRAFKPAEGGAKFRWVQQIAPNSKNFNYGQFADKLWHFFWNAYKLLDGTSAWTLDKLGLAYELKSRSSPIWSAITLKPLDRDAKEDIWFNHGGIAFAEWLNDNHAEVTKAYAAAIRDRFLAAGKQIADFNKLSEIEKANFIQQLMEKKEVQLELKKNTYLEFARAAEGIVGNVVNAIKKKMG
ncbi:MAG: S8 family peptidase [bacterium]